MIKQELSFANGGVKCSTTKTLPPHCVQGARHTESTGGGERLCQREKAMVRSPRQGAKKRAG